MDPDSDAAWLEVEVTVTSDKNQLCLACGCSWPVHTVALHLQNGAAVAHGDFTPFPTAGRFGDDEFLKLLSRDGLKFAFRRRLCDCPWVRDVMKATLVVKGESLSKMVPRHSGW